MTPERYQQIKQVFAEACRMAPDIRSAYLDKMCADDAELRGEVETLLEHDERSLPLRPGLSAATALGLGQMDAGAGSSALAGFQPTTDAPPARIGDFRIHRELGHGGMGVVYEAEQDNPRRAIALKVIRPGATSEQLQRRFKFEAQILGRLQHPGIAQIYEAGMARVETSSGPTAEQPYFAMEYVRGRPLGDYLKAKRLGVRQRLELFAKICEAVHHAHQKGVIHRDLKPGNILIDEQGRPKILDFGVARFTDADVQITTVQTDVGQLIGTIPYMSPEQVAGNTRDLDTRSDVYALGVVCYEMLTGRLPYDLKSKTIPEAARMIAEVQPARPSTFNRLCRGDLDTIIAKVLEKDKDRRYQSASDLATDIRRYLADQPIEARSTTFFYQFSKFARRNPVLVASLIGFVLVLAAGTIVSTWQSFRAHDAEELAQQRFIQAETARQLAEQRRSEAALEATRALAVRDFLVQMLESVNPEAAQGRDVELLRIVLDEAAADIQTELADYPEVQADIHQVIGTVYRNISLYDKAEPHFQVAFDLRAARLGADDVRTLASLGWLAQVQWDQGRLEQAREMYQEQIAGYNRTIGPKDRETLTARYNLAGVLHESEQVEQAEEEFHAVLAEMHAHLDKHDDALLDAMNGLAALTIERGGDLDEVEQLLSTVVQRWAETHGPLHPQRLRALKNLAIVVKEQGRLAEAEILARESLQLHQEIFGEEHHAAIQARINLASLLCSRDMLDEAESLARTALSQATDVLGPEHPDTLKAISHLGIILRNTGKLAEAQTFLEDAVTLSGVLYGEQAPDTLNRLSSLAGLLNEQGKLAEAEIIMRQVVEGLQAVYGESSSHTLAAMNNLGLLLMELGKLDDAESILQRSIELTDAAAPPGHWFRWTVRLTYGQCLLRMERFEEAEELLQGCYAGLDGALGGAHHRTHKAAQELAELYRVWGRPEQAAEWRAKLISEEDATLNDDE